MRHYAFHPYPRLILSNESCEIVAAWGDGTYQNQSVEIVTRMVIVRGTPPKHVKIRTTLLVAPHAITSSVEAQDPVER